MRSLLISTLAICAFMSSAAQNIDRIAIQIASQNPGIASSTYADRIRAEELRSQNMLDDPNVEVEQLWGGKQAGNKFTASISQDFSMPSVYKKRNAAADAVERSAEHLQQATLMQTALDAKLTIYKIINLKRGIALLRKNMADIDSLERAASKAQAGGEITLLDVKKLRIEHINLDARVCEMEAEIAPLLGQLSELGNGSDYSDLISPLVAYQPEQMLTIAQYQEHWAEDPRMKYNLAMAESQDALLDVAKAERLPQLSLGYVYNREDGMTFNGFSAGITLPVYSNKHRRGAIALERESKIAENAAIETNNKAEIVALHKEATMMHDHIAHLKPEIDDPTISNLLERAYEKRLITVVDYLQQLNYFTDATLALYDSEFRYAVALARLNKYQLK